ncbi:RNA polymerase II transcription factor B subunit 4 [Savitreella phatthalungensis]
MDGFETLREPQISDAVKRIDRAAKLEQSSVHGLETDPALLVLIIDTCPSAWQLVSGQLSFAQALGAILVFLNAHLSLSAVNRTAVIASHTDSARWLYPRRSRKRVRPQTLADNGSFINVDRAANGYRPFIELQDEVTMGLRRLFAEDQGAVGDDEMKTSGASSSLMSGAISMALSFINRASMDTEGEASGDSTMSSVPQARSGHTQPGRAEGVSQVKSRIMILSASSDLALQYIPMMNCIFAAQKKRVAIDVCKIGVNAAFLQQASDATRGVYQQLASPSPTVLLQYLMALYLPDQSLRRWLMLPSQANVDFRAACFCHKKVLDIGFVCSVCLSIFCQAYAKCMTCDAEFDLDEMMVFGKKPAVAAAAKKSRTADLSGSDI